MNDDQKTKEQLLEELEQERERSAQAEERSLALQEVSKRVAAAHDTDEVLDLIVNEAARLVGTAWIHEDVRPPLAEDLFSNMKFAERNNDRIGMTDTVALLGTVLDSAPIRHESGGYTIRKESHYERREYHEVAR